MILALRTPQQRSQLRRDEERSGDTEQVVLAKLPMRVSGGRLRIVEHLELRR